MSTPDRINSSGLILLASETGENNTASGNKYERTFTGSKADVLAQRQVEIFGGASLVKYESMADGNYKLTASYPFDRLTGSNAEKPVNCHELEIDRENVSVWVNQNLLATFLSTFGSQAAANSALAYLQTQVIPLTTGQTAQEALITANYAGSQQALMLNAFRGVVCQGVSSSTQYNTVYRRRITAASYNQVTAAFTGAKQIWTTAEILAFENVPSSWWFQLPTQQWLKAPPRCCTVANQKTEIAYEYIGIYQAWGLLYTAYNSATLINF